MTPSSPSLSLSLLFISLVSLLSLLSFNEVIVYFLTSVPYVCSSHTLSSLSAVTTDTQSRGNVRVLLISDPHILHFSASWIDRIRREWSMKMGYLAATAMYSPDMAIFVGDLFDKGALSESEWFAYYHRFQWVFPPHYAHQEVLIAIELTYFSLDIDIGNHDIHGNRKLSEDLFDRVFGNRFRVVNLKGYSFVFVDSNSLTHSSSHKHDTFTFLKEDIPSSSLSLLFSHMPLYRHNETLCHDIDANCRLLERFKLRSDPSKTQCDEFIQGTFNHVNEPDFEVLNADVTNDLLLTFQPHLIVSGHLHYSCLHVHKYSHTSKVTHSFVPILDRSLATATEITVPTFNWRNRVDPSYVILDLDKSGEVRVRKCFLPNEMTIFGIYIVSGISLCVFILWTCVTSLYPLIKKKK